MAGSKTINVDVQPWKYKAAVGLVTALSALVAILEFAGAKSWFGGIHIGSFVLWYLDFLFLFVLIYCLASIEFVRTNEFGGVTVLGHEALEVMRGLVFVPRIIATLHTAPRSVQEEQFPADPERVRGHSEYKDIGPDLLEPMRITTGGPEEGSDDILNVRLTFEPLVSVHWQVEHKGFFEFFVNIPGEDWPAKKAYLLRRMRDTTQGLLVEEFRQHSAAWVITHLTEIREELSQELTEATDEWGITICETNIQNVTPPHATNTALAKVPSAKAEAIAIEITAGATKKKLVLEAEGEAEGRKAKAEAHKAELAAEGEGLAAAAKSLEMPGADYYAGQIAKDSIGAGDIVLGAEGLAQLTGLGKIIFKGKDAKP